VTSLQKDELSAMFGKIKLNGQNGITDGAELLDIVSSTIQSGGLAQAATVAVMLMKNWVVVWEKLEQGLEGIINWVENAWQKVKNKAQNFWEWLISFSIRLLKGICRSLNLFCKKSSHRQSCRGAKGCFIFSVRTYAFIFLNSSSLAPDGHT
jgi:hypothetical protein